MEKIKEFLRTLLWRILGVDYKHILKIIDYTLLKEDKYTYIGEGSYDNNAIVYRWSDAPLTIGKYCSIAHNVKFVLDEGKHLRNGVTSYPFINNPIGTKSGICIGNDVWVGLNATILYGVKIGNGVTIASGSVVTQDIPDYCVVGGVPAKIISHKCKPEEKQELNTIAWWNWSSDIIKSRQADFQLSIPQFISKYKKQ